MTNTTNRATEIIEKSILIATMENEPHVQWRQGNGRMYFLSPKTGIHSVSYSGSLQDFSRAEAHWEGFKFNQTNNN